MKIDCVVLGCFQTNAYVVRDQDQAGPGVVIDPGLEPDVLMDFLRSESVKPNAVVLTHGHVDHIAGVMDVIHVFPDVKLYVHRLDAPMLSDSVVNLSVFLAAPCEIDQPNTLVEDGQVIEEAGLRLQVIHTPGHTPGGISLYSKIDDVLFTGDALFNESIGRSDFPGGDPAELVSSIRKRLLVLPEQTRVYPGHGSETTIAWERRHNPFLR
jgi:hydroxyacylglutathione hydrolase